jgi:hypothetical protein
MIQKLMIQVTIHAWVKVAVTIGLLMCGGCTDAPIINPASVPVPAAGGPSVGASIPAPAPSAVDADKLGQAVADALGPQLNDINNSLVALRDPRQTQKLIDKVVEGLVPVLEKQEAGPKPDDLIGKGEKSAVEELPEITGYCPSWCVICRPIEKELEGNTTFRFLFLSDESQYPRYITRDGGLADRLGFPIFTWEIKGKEFYYNPPSGGPNWNGLQALIHQYDKSQHTVRKNGNGNGDARRMKLNAAVSEKANAMRERRQSASDLGAVMRYQSPYGLTGIREHMKSIPHGLSIEEIDSMSNPELEEWHDQYRAKRQQLRELMQAERSGWDIRPYPVYAPQQWVEPAPNAPWTYGQSQYVNQGFGFGQPTGQGVCTNGRCFRR